MNSTNKYLHLNKGGAWPSFQWRGLELREDGALQLCSVPILEGKIPPELDQLGTPSGPAGLAITPEGNVFYTVPDEHRLYRIDGCDQTVAPVPCLGGEGRLPPRLLFPRGLLWSTHRKALFVVDSGNHRIQVFDPDSLQPLEVWGHINGRPQPGLAPGHFWTPWTIAQDDDGYVYVVDYGNRRIQKISPLGDPIPSFCEALSDSGLLSRPVDIAVCHYENTTCVLVVDAGSRSILAFDGEGEMLFSTTGEFGLPMGIIASDKAVYVGDNSSRSVAKLRSVDKSMLPVGEAIGYSGPVAALAFKNEHEILVHTGTACVPVTLKIDFGYRTSGFIWSQPIAAGPYKVGWHRAKALVERTSDSARLRLYTANGRLRTDKLGNPLPEDPLVDAPVVTQPKGDPFDDSKDPNGQQWRPSSAEVDLYTHLPDVYIGGEDSQHLWIGAFVSGDGKSTPVVRQIRVEYDQDAYLQYLPAIYRNDRSCRNFPKRFLALFESLFDDTERTIEDLPSIFDPVVVPTPLLQWLAGWLALDLDEDWDEATMRREIANAFANYAKRGTPAGLRAALRQYAGVETHIVEPILNAAWWSLPEQKRDCQATADPCPDTTEPSWEGGESSALGFTTMLVGAQPQGAVVGTTATLDRSHLINGEEFGAPLFDDIAHRFNVLVHRRDLKCAETVRQIHEVVERHMPAHTDYHLCVIEPLMRVGYQARVGLDAVVGGPSTPTRLGDPTARGNATVLGGELPGTIAGDNRIGLNTRLG